MSTKVKVLYSWLILTALLQFMDDGRNLLNWQIGKFKRFYNSIEENFVIMAHYHVIV